MTKAKSTKSKLQIIDSKVDSFTLVIFGGAGDLSQRLLLPSLYHLFCEKQLTGKFSVLGLGRSKLSNQDYHNLMKTAIRKFSPECYEEKEYTEFAKHLHYKSADVTDEKSYPELCESIQKVVAVKKGSKPNVVFYLAVPPNILTGIVNNLHQLKLCTGGFNTKLIIEKPFGRDRQTAIELNKSILKVFSEKQIYRVDHFLGKNTVQNIIYFRFANSIFEPLWNRSYIDHVQITVAEDIGIGHRGSFYENTGVIRDMLQNHLLQLIALIGMEPPLGFEADLIRDEKVKLLRTIRPVTPKYIDRFMVRGQYGPGKIKGKTVKGYREEKNVAPGSQTATFFAGKFIIDNWRWADVPFYVRVGKRMPEKLSQIYVEFKKPPLRLFGNQGDTIQPNAIVLTLQPHEEIELKMSVKYPGMGNKPHTVDMDFNYEETFNLRKHKAYERLLVDCIKGDLTLFARQDGIEAMWSVVDPIVKKWESISAKNFLNYPAGTWGPKEANKLMEKENRKWRTLDE